jgi:glucosamine-6-phosphate deaminase
MGLLHFVDVVRVHSAATMPQPLSMLNTIRGSQLEGFYPRGWNLRKIDRCCAMNLAQLTRPAKFWNRDFRATAVEEIGTPMGAAIADVIETTRRDGRELAIILPVGPVIMYKTVVARLLKSRTKCDHVTTFNMDEWADRRGNSMPGDQPGGFEHTMGQWLFDPLKKLTVPKSRRSTTCRRTRTRSRR